MVILDPSKIEEYPDLTSRFHIHIYCNLPQFYKGKYKGRLYGGYSKFGSELEEHGEKIDIQKCIKENGYQLFLRDPEINWRSYNPLFVFKDNHTDYMY